MRPFLMPARPALALLLVLGLSSTSAHARQEAVALFNGTDLSGWQVYGTEEWYVEDGTLVCASGPDAGYGYLATDRVFRDFDLEVDFLQEADGNSGVFFRSWITGTRIRGWQAEVAPPGRATGGVYESYGRGWLARPDSSVETGAFRPGDWNRLRVRVVGGHVRTWLNDVPMVDFTDDRIAEASGRIALQIHDGGGIRVRWRRLLLTPLPAPDP